MTFIEDRRDPTGRRSWRHAPVFVGDLAAHVDNPGWMMLVTGVLATADGVTVGADGVGDFGGGSGPPTRPNPPRTPGLPLPGATDDDEPLFGVERDEDTFETGFRSGSDAADEITSGTRGDPFGFGR